MTLTQVFTPFVSAAGMHNLKYNSEGLNLDS